MEFQPGSGQNHLYYLEKSQKALDSSDHLAYITYPLLKEIKLLRKIFEDMGIALNNLIKATIVYEEKKSKITVYGEDRMNNLFFLKKLSLKYNITQNEVTKLAEFLDLFEQYKVANFDFIKHNNLVLLSPNLRSKTISFEQVKEYLNLIKITSIKIKKNLN